jgi:hypothetical protein
LKRITEQLVWRLNDACANRKKFEMLHYAGCFFAGPEIARSPDTFSTSHSLALATVHDML